MQVVVECQPGHGGEWVPASFTIARRRVSVREIVDQWFGTDHRYVKLRGDDGAEYILRHDAETQRWELHLFTQA